MKKWRDFAGLLAVGWLAFGQAQALAQVQIETEVEITQVVGGNATSAADKLKEVSEQLGKAAEHLQEAAAKHDAKTIAAALRQLNQARQGLDEISKLLPKVKVRINGQPADPNDNGQIVIPRIIIPQNAPQKKPAPGKEENQAEGGAAKPAAKFERTAFGLVWRDLSAALQEAKKTGKPVFCLRTLGDLFGGDL